MYGWLRRTFGRKATKTAGREVSQEIGEKAGKSISQETGEEVGESSAIKSGLIGAGVVGALVYPEEIASKIGSTVGAGLGGVGKGVVNTVFDSPVMVGVGLLMVGGIFYAIFK